MAKSSNKRKNGKTMKSSNKFNQKRSTFGGTGFGSFRIMTNQDEKEKPNSEMRKVFAVRHTDDGMGDEFCYFSIPLGKSANPKNALLQEICTKDWLHTPPVDLIAQYLSMTATFNAYPNAAGYSIEFFKNDPELPGTFSCRQMIAFRTEEAIDKHANEYKANLDRTKISVREYA